MIYVIDVPSIKESIAISISGHIIILLSTETLMDTNNMNIICLVVCWNEYMLESLCHVEPKIKYNAC